MSKLFDRLDDKKRKDIRVLSDFIFIFCRENHREEYKDTFISRDARLSNSLGHRSLILCQNCRKLLSYGIVKLLQCSYHPKPACNKCANHCYTLAYREKVRQIMRFSSRYLIKHGRLDLLAHYLF
ncbi:nitrous oxide-stimulated promoter family protein [Chloroflexota bacterium]